MIYALVLLLVNASLVLRTSCSQERPATNPAFLKTRSLKKTSESATPVIKLAPNALAQASTSARTATNPTISRNQLAISIKPAKPSWKAPTLLRCLGNCLRC